MPSCPALRHAVLARAGACRALALPSQLVQRRQQSRAAAAAAATELAQSPADQQWFLLADIHLGPQTRRRLEPFFDYFFERFDQEQPRHVMFLGDTFNARSGADPHDHRLFTDILQRLVAAPWAPQIHLLVGNHDMKNLNNRADNSLYPFRLAKGKIHVYDEITEKILARRRTVFIPYHRDEKTVREYIAGVEKTQARTIAFFHGSVEGAIMSGASDSSHAVCHGSPMNSSNLGRFKQAFLGHFHTHGPVTGSPSVVYVGAPLQTNMGDAGDLNRGFLAYWPATGRWELNRNPHAEYFLKTGLDGVDAVLERAEDKKIQVELRAGEDDGMAIDAAREKLYEHGALSVEIKPFASPAVPEEDVPIDPVQEERTIQDVVESFMATRAELPYVKATLEKTRKQYLLSLIAELQRGRTELAGDGAETFHAQLARIEMHNFRGVRGTTVVDLEALPRAQVFLVSGLNGAGKTTLIDAVVWCLFGELLVRNVTAEEISHDGATHCEVTLAFRNGYRFTRARSGKKTKRPSFTITNPDGEVEEHGHDAMSNTRYAMEHILHTNLSMFKQSVVIGDNAEYFVRAAGDKERTECMDALFGLDILAACRETLRENRATLRDQLAELTADETRLKSSLADAEQQQRSATAQLQRDDQLTTELQQRIAILRANAARFLAQQRTLERTSATYQEELATLKAETRKAHEATAGLLAEQRQLQQEAEKVRAAVRDDEQRIRGVYARRRQTLLDYHAALGKMHDLRRIRAAEQKYREQEQEIELQRRRAEVQRRLMEERHRLLDERRWQESFYGQAVGIVNHLVDTVARVLGVKLSLKLPFLRGTRRALEFTTAAPIREEKRVVPSKAENMATEQIRELAGRALLLKRELDQYRAEDGKKLEGADSPNTTTAPPAPSSSTTENAGDGPPLEDRIDLEQALSEMQQSANSHLAAASSKHQGPLSTLQSQQATLSQKLSSAQQTQRTLSTRDSQLSSQLSRTQQDERRANAAHAAASRDESSTDGKLELLAHQRSQLLASLSTLEARVKDLAAQLIPAKNATAKARRKDELASFWAEQLLDSERKKGAFLTHARAAYIRDVNATLKRILPFLCPSDDDSSSPSAPLPTPPSSSYSSLSTTDSSPGSGNGSSEGSGTTTTTATATTTAPATLLAFTLSPDFQLKPTPGALSLGRRSRGQKTRTYLVLFLALFLTARARSHFRPYFIFMDEIIDSLDLAGIEGLQNWLARYAREQDTRVFLLTHREPSLVGSVIEVEKKPGGRVEYRLRK